MCSCVSICANDQVASNCFKREKNSHSMLMENVHKNAGYGPSREVALKLKAKTNSGYFDPCLKNIHLNLSNSNSCNWDKIFRSLENLLKNLYNSNLCNSNFLKFEHFYDPSETSNYTELTAFAF